MEFVGGFFSSPGGPKNQKTLLCSYVKGKVAKPGRMITVSVTGGDQFEGA